MQLYHKLMVLIYTWTWILLYKCGFLSTNS